MRQIRHERCPDSAAKPLNFCLDNGLRVILAPDDGSPAIAIHLGYSAGSRNDPRDQSGLAHLFEHLLFQGSLHVPRHEHFRHIQRVGGFTNAATWFDRTSYFCLLPSSCLDLGLWLESDRMGFFLPALTEDSFRIQQQVVLNERRETVVTRPYGRATETVYQALYPEGHPYRRPISGYEQDIEALTPEAAEAFFRAYYLPGNAVLTIAGNFEIDQALESTELYFGDLDPGPAPEQPEIRFEPQRGERRLVLHDAVRFPRLYLAFEVPDFGSPTWLAADLLAHILASGKTSILAEDLVHCRGLASEARVRLTAMSGTTVLWLMITSSGSGPIEELERRVCGHLEEIAAAPVAEAHFDRARNWLANSLHHDQQSLVERAERLSRWTMYRGQPITVNEELERYSQLTPADILDFARIHLSAERRTLLTVLPTASG